MRTIAHISDLHFGRTDPAVLEGLKMAIVGLKPDIVVVSGDLTQRAKRHEFAEAKRFLDALPRPQIVVPGNHDVPLYNVLKRWLTPLANYHRYISKDPAPVYSDDLVAVLGINTARAFTFKNGRINKGQVAQACAALAPLNAGVVRIVVTHHPFALPESGARKAIVGRAKMAMAAFAECNVDVVLSGHLHVSQAVTSEAIYAGGRAALLVQAGTATSTRRRDEPNAFNLLRIERDGIEIERYGWATSGFGLAACERFHRTAAGWIKDLAI
jgi:3',5'-cyclic AMP phosphodiesterase CpdA